MGLCWSSHNIEFDEESWENLSPPRIPHADAYIEKQEAKQRVEEANQKMYTMAMEEKKRKRKVKFEDGYPVFDLPVRHVQPIYGPPSPISVKSFDPADIECDCGYNCGHGY